LNQRAFDSSNFEFTRTGAAEPLGHALHRGIVLRAGTWVQQDGYPLHSDERDQRLARMCGVE
jgi:hypothetical protein